MISDLNKDNKRIKYVVSYDCPENSNENRVNILASSNKIDYIVQKINELGYGVDLISTSQTKNNRFYRGKCYSRGINTLRLFPTTPRGGIVKKAINVVVMRFAIALFFLRNVKKRETIIIYHSVGNMWMINFLKWFKRAKIIEEVEEIYGDIYGKPWLSKREIQVLRKANAYIYPTRMLNQVVNDKGKNFIVIHGSYKLPDSYIDKSLKFSAQDGLYHVGYTGILDPKKGCLSFIRAAEYLDSTYCLHVLGFGSDHDINFTRETIELIKRKTNCQIRYDGVKRGLEYDMYLQSLDAGICPLDSEDYFVKTQFPSKIISYLSNGLQVICSDIEVVKTSDVNNEIIFYNGNSPECIANAIREARKKIKNTDPVQVINWCNEKFKRDLKNLIMEEVEQNEL